MVLVPKAVCLRGFSRLLHVPIELRVGDSFPSMLERKKTRINSAYATLNASTESDSELLSVTAKVGSRME